MYVKHICYELMNHVKHVMLHIWRNTQMFSHVQYLLKTPTLTAPTAVTDMNCYKKTERKKNKIQSSCAVVLSYCSSCE